MLKKRKENQNDDMEMTGENNVDETELETVEEKSAQKIAELKEKLQRSEAERRKLMEDLQRAKADFLNARKRLEEEKQNDKKRSLQNHLAELLPLCDSFEAALSDDALTGSPENLQKGLRGIHAQLLNLLRTYEVVAFGMPGEAFDPNIHEALSEVKVGDAASDHKVIAVVQKGYKMDDALLRPARVTVGIFKS